MNAIILLLRKKDWAGGLRILAWGYRVLSIAFLLLLLYDLMTSKGGSATDLTFDSFIMIDISLLCIIHRERFHITYWSIYQVLSIILIIVGVTTLLVGVSSERPEVYFTFSPIVIIDLLLLFITTFVRKIRKDGIFSIFTLMYSTCFRLTLCYIALLILVLFIFSSSIYTSENIALKTSLNEYMTKHFAQIAATYNVQTQHLSLTNAEEQLGNPNNDTILLLNPHGDVLQSYDSIINSELDVPFITQQSVQLSQRFMNDPSWQQEALPLITLPHGSASVYYLGDSYTYNLQGMPYQFSQVIISNSQHKVVALLVLGTPSNIDAILHNLQVIIEIAAPLVLLLSSYGGYWLAARAMRPVQTITHTVKQIGETDLHRRLNLKKRDELGELAATFDHMLDRLEAAFERQRQFTADASHELRTPLTIVDLETTRALTHDLTLEEYQHALNIVQQENRHMAHLVNDLLTLARADSEQAQLKQ